MRFTIYGFFSVIASIVFLSIFDVFNFKFLAILLAAILGQNVMCEHCGDKYVMSSYISLLTILVCIFENCSRIKNFVVAFSLLAAIGRIGCLFTGCCTGKETNQSGIIYRGNYLINKKLNKKIVKVKPTILYEIFIQFLLAILFIKYQQLYILFPILNAILIYITNKWRLTYRMGKNKNLSPILLIISFFIILFKCQNLNNTNNRITFKFKNVYIIISLFLGLILSNDINISYVKKKLKISK